MRARENWKREKLRAQVDLNSLDVSRQGQLHRYQCFLCSWVIRIITVLKVQVWINLNAAVQAIFVYILYYFTGKFIAKIPDPESSMFFIWAGTQQQSTLWIQKFINLYLNYVTDGTSSCFYAVLCARGFIREPRVLHLSLSVPALEMCIFCACQ